MNKQHKSDQVSDAQIWDRCPTQTRSANVYSGKATEIVPNKLREEAFEWVGNEVVFSDILEVKLADGTRVRGCFALRHRTRHVLGIAFDYHMRADLVTDAIETMAFEVPGSIWQSEEAQTLWGGPDPLLALAKPHELEDIPSLVLW